MFRTNTWDEVLRIAGSKTVCYVCTIFGHPAFKNPHAPNGPVIIYTGS